MTTQEYVAQIWHNPEDTLQVLIREMVDYYSSRRELGRVVEEQSKSRYPEDHVSGISVTFWISWAFGKQGRLARTPNLKNGIRLFRILLDLKTQNEKNRTPE